MLIHLEYNPVAVQRRHFEQNLAGLHRRAKGLTEVSADQYAVKRRMQLGTADLLLHQFQFRIHLLVRTRSMLSSVRSRFASASWYSFSILLRSLCHF